MRVRGRPADRLRRAVTAYWGFESTAAGRVRQREGPGAEVVVLVSFGNEWRIDGERRTSFVGGLRCSRVTTEHTGWSYGMHVGLAPWAAHAVLGVPMHELAETTVPFEDLLPRRLVDRLEGAPDWDDRFSLLDDFLGRRLADARPVSPEVIWAWERLRRTHGRERVASLAEELGWSRKRLVARFREQVGLPPKAAARLLRFERARELAGTMRWGEVAFACGFADQPHLISEFRAFTGRTPETFLQDELAAGA
ncbi:MAG: helix-turn-helix domain-containing protein [Actinomycetota bacterium]|nr:helix-turn-helix domain-containing protein [Actinomycetota bacterium]